MQIPSDASKIRTFQKRREVWTDRTRWPIKHTALASSPVAPFGIYTEPHASLCKHGVIVLHCCYPFISLSHSPDWTFPWRMCGSSCKCLTSTWREEGRRCSKDQRLQFSQTHSFHSHKGNFKNFINGRKTQVTLDWSVFLIKHFFLNV